MSNLVRFGVSIDRELIKKFDKLIKEKNYKNRSEAIRDLIRENLVKKEWVDKDIEVIGCITIVYDHHKRELVNRIINIQHQFGKGVLATQHVHLDHHNCLEVIITKGKPKKVERLAYKLNALKGTKHTEIMMTTTGKQLP